PGAALQRELLDAVAGFRGGIRKKLVRGKESQAQQSTFSRRHQIIEPGDFAQFSGLRNLHDSPGITFADQQAALRVDHGPGGFESGGQGCWNSLRFGSRDWSWRWRGAAGEDQSAEQDAGTQEAIHRIAMRGLDDGASGDRSVPGS